MAWSYKELYLQITNVQKKFVSDGICMAALRVS